MNSTFQAEQRSITATDSVGLLINTCNRTDIHNAIEGNSEGQSTLLGYTIRDRSRDSAVGIATGYGLDDRVPVG
jgi:hypothetical protein